VADLAKALDQVRKCIARSASDFVEEARTAAHTACRLIREHGLVVGPPDRRGPPPPPPPPKADTWGPLKIRSRYGGVCAWCGDPYFVDDDILWRKGRGATHVECRDDWREKA
jgi:hypothetical protein